MEQKTEELYYRKGQLAAGAAVGAIITLIVGIGVAVLILIFVGTIGGSTYNLLEDDLEAIGNNVVKNDGFTALNNTVVALDHSFVQEDTLAIFNNTGGKTAINLNNFTIDYDAGTVLLKSTSDVSLNNSAMAANYTWGAAEVRTSAKAGILGGFEALEQTGNYLPIIVLAVVIAVVLAMVIGFAATGGSGYRGSAL